MMPRALRYLGRFRYSLRMLFLLMTVVCLWLGWNASVVHSRRQTLHDVEARGARVISGHTLVNGAWLSYPATATPPSQTISSLSIDPTEAPLSCIRRLLGDHTIAVIYLPSSEFTSIDGENIQAVFPEALLLPGPFGVQPVVALSAEDS